MGTRFYSNIYLSFVLILLIGVICSALIFGYFSTKIVTQEIYNANMKALNYVVDNMNVAFENIDNIALQLSNDPGVNFFAYRAFSDDYFGLKRLSQNIDSLKITNSYLDSIYVYYKDNDAIITSPDGKMSLESFYDTLWMEQLSFQGEIQWIFNRRFSRPRGTNGYENKSVISYIRYMPLGSAYKNGAVIVNIDVNKLNAMLDQNDIGAGGVMIVNDDGDIVASSVKGLNIDSKTILTDIKQNEALNDYEKANLDGKYYIKSYFKDDRDWTYIMFTPMETLMNTQNMIRNIVFISTLLALFIGIILSSTFSKRLYTPIKELMGAVIDGNIKEKEGCRSSYYRFEEFKAIQGFISDVVENNELLIQENKHFESYAKERIILGLLYGNVSINDLKADNLDFISKGFNKLIMLVIDMDDYEELIQRYTDDQLSRIQYLITEICNSSILTGGNIKVNVVKTYPHQWACIIVSHDSAFDDPYILNIAFRTAENLKAIVNTQLNLRVTIGISKSVTDVSQIRDMYLQACEAIKYRITQGGNNIIYFGHTALADKPLYAYPQHQEEELINALKAMDKEAAHRAVLSFVKHISCYKWINHDYVYYIFAQLIGSIMRLIYGFGASATEIWDKGNIFEDLSKCQLIEDIETILIKFVDETILYIESKQNNKYVILIDSCTEYINKHYSDKQLSVEELSSKVYLSPAYLEKIFKEMRGQTVLDFINAVRMEKAKLMLKETNLKIEDIADKVGYNTARGFIRAFKKYENMTPGQYRHHLLEQKINDIPV
ncbi:AraC family transcriptional regulator [Mahella sp.]|uniref:AraC family transcriptional regulator n=1 Tax=Mahella sp. TaxID=2798721 RepID=UPI0025C67A5D|nr:AraC family transcriptional regulator [Mahella sp.]MBZ4665628.1 transcriptional regulator, AraC family [Mahella sp.]